MWRDGSPEENPIEIFFRMALCLAMILCFHEIFSIISSVITNIYSSVAVSGSSGMGSGWFDIGLDTYNSMTDSLDIEIENSDFAGFDVLIKNIKNSLIELAISIVQILLLVMYMKYALSALVHIIQNGIELFIIKCGFPLACLGLTKPNGGSFYNYVTMLVKDMAVVILNGIFLSLSFSVMAELSTGDLGSFIFSFLTALALCKMASGSNAMLSAFLGSSGSSMASSGFGNSKTVSNIKDNVRTSVGSMLPGTLGKTLGL